jgi:hypothetical protein
VPALVGVTTQDGVVLFEGQFSEAGLVEIGFEDKVEDIIATTRSSATALAAAIRSCADSLLGAFDDLTTPQGATGLSEAVVELGVSVTGEGNVFVVKGTAEANLKVTLTWKFS